MDEIINVLIKLVGMLAGFGIVWLLRVAGEYLKQKGYNDELDRFITSLVKAAEQMYWNEDGSFRLDYVQTALIEAGYDLTDAVRALIEAKVYEINNGGEEE